MSSDFSLSSYFSLVTTIYKILFDLMYFFFGMKYMVTSLRQCNKGHLKLFKDAFGFSLDCLS
jgi:hypothetical protein